MAGPAPAIGLGSEAVIHAQAHDVVVEAVIGAGPVLKRFSPRAKGSAGGILKRTSHIFITLAEAPEGDAKPKKVNVSPKASKDA